MKGMKKTLALLVIFCMVVTLFTACGSSKSDKEDAAVTDGASDTEKTDDVEKADDTEKVDDTESGEKQTLRVTWWGNTERDKLYYKINDLFMKENPNVEIVTESPGWNDYWTAVATSYASRTAPDVVQFQSNQIGEYASKNVLTPLNSYVDSGAINLDNWNMDLVSTGNYNENLYMVTLGITAQTMYVNKTLCDELGIELWGEEEDISWEDFEKFLNDTQKKLPADTYSCADFYTNNDLVWVWVRQNTPAGVEWVDADGKFAPTKETMSSWYSLGDRLRKSGAIAPITKTQEWEQKAWEEGPFVKRNVLFYFANANQIKTYQRATQDEIVLRKVPVAKNANNEHGDLLITSSFAISETSEQKDLAAKYIDFFVNNEEAQKIFNYELGVPGSLTIQDVLSKTADPSDIMATNYVNLVSQNTLPFKAKEPGVWAIQNEIASVAQQVATDSMTADKAAEYIIGCANDVISENQ